MRALKSPLVKGVGGVVVAEHEKLSGFDFFSAMGNPKYVVAPMVEQSELPYRMLTRKYGAELCYTPMFHARLFVQQQTYRNECFSTCPEDRPLLVQFCGNDPDILLAAGKLVEDHCDGVDLNLGCPQAIARKGRYGSFLLEETELLYEIVSTLHAKLKVPVTCKIRLLTNNDPATKEQNPYDLDATIRLVDALISAGCQLLTVHGRTKEQNKHLVKQADWDAIATIVRHVRAKPGGGIPIVANGGIACLEDVHSCLDHTGVAGVMTSEAVLECPALFSGGKDPETGQMQVLYTSHQ